MSLSNRVSVDTDVLFVRNMFVFSTNTNNVPVSTNTILAIGSNGQMVASNTLFNLSSYGVGYLPSTLSSLNGEIISVGNLVLSGGVVPAQLFSVQTALQSSISTTQGSVDTLSSYVLLNVIPSTVSTLESQISSLNSSFEGYVTGTSVTPGQLASTYTAATEYTDQQISTLSTTTFEQICTLSNYFDVSSATVTQFSSLAGNVSAQSNYFSTQLYLTNSNFNALSASTRLLNESNSTLIGGLEEEVSTLSNIVVNTSTITTPLGTLGLLSTSQCANWPFFSNIKVSSIDVRAAGTALAPAINFTSGGDSDTGIYHPGDGIIAFTTNSGERLRIEGVATKGSTFINLYGTSNGFAALNPYNSPALVLTGGCNDNANATRIELNMPSTAYKTFLAGETGGGGLAFRQLQTFAYDLTSGGLGTINLATSIHSTGNFAIKTTATASNALYVNGSTFINGQMGVAAAGSAAAPALYFSEAGNDTGFFKPGDGAIAVTTNSGERFRFSGTQVIGCNIDMYLYGSNNGTITLQPNSVEPQINLNTISTSGAPYISFSNINVNFKTYLGGDSFGSTHNQLITYSYPGANEAIAIHSTGAVAIGGPADPTFALTVNGGVRQTAPYIWSYYTQSLIPSLTATGIAWSNVEYSGPGSPLIFANLIYSIQYAGVYKIDFVTNLNATGFTGLCTIELYTRENGGAITQKRLASANGSTTISLTYTSYYGSVGLDLIYFLYTLNNGSSAQTASNVTMTIQYLG